MKRVHVRVRKAVTVSLCCVAVLASAATPPIAETEQELLQRLEQRPESLEAAGVHQYYVDDWPRARPEEKLRFVAAAIAHQNQEIVRYGAAAAEQYAILHPELRHGLPSRQLYLLATTARDTQLRGLAVRAWYAIERDSADVDKVLAGMLDRETGESVAVELIRMLTLDGITGIEEESLLRVASHGTSRSSFSATQTLAHQGVTSTAVLAALMNHVESDAYFAHPNLIQTIPRFGKVALPYIPRLEQLRERLVELVSTEHEAQQIPLYADGRYYVEIMDKTLQQVHAMRDGTAR